MEKLLKQKNEEQSQLISVIIPTYNRVGLLERSVKSVLSQTYTNLELLIIDEPTTGLDPEERIRIRNFLVDFSENRTVLFSTHVVEDLAAAANIWLS